MAVIELDRAAPDPPARPPVGSYRTLGLVLAAVLTAALGAAAPAAAGPWREVGAAPLNGPDAFFTIAGDRLLTMDGSFDRRRAGAWSIPGADRLWQGPVPSPGRGVDGGYLRGSGTLTRDDDFVLLRSGATTATTVLDPATGAVRWSSPATVVPVGAGTGVVQSTEFAPGTEYQTVGSGDPGELYWSATGNPHLAAPLRTTLTGTDLATGRARWSVERPGALWPVAAPDDAVVVVSAGRVVRLDAGTGAVLRDRGLPTDRGRISGAGVQQGVLLIRYGDFNRTGTQTAYSLDGLEPLWSTPDPPAGGTRGACFALLCEQRADTLAVLDPRTGATLWTAGTDTDLFGHGDWILESATISGAALRIRDPATGAVRAELDGWQPVPFPADGSPPVLTRNDPETGTVAFGTVRPGRPSIQPLGATPAPATDCVSTARYVACRSLGLVVVWAYAS